MGNTRQHKTTVRKWFRILLSFIIGTALLAIFAWLINFKSSNIEMYIDKCMSIVVGFLDLDSASIIDPRILAACIVWISLAGTVVTAYMLPLRLTGVLKKTIGFSNHFKIILAVYFVVVCTMYIIVKFCDGTVGNMSEELFSILHHGDKLEFIMYLILLIGLFICSLVAIMGSAIGLGKLLVINCSDNGIFGGIVYTFYDIFISIFIVAAVLMAIAAGVVFVIGLPIALIAGSDISMPVEPMDRYYRDD